MGWLDRFKARKQEPVQKRRVKRKTPYCSKCSCEIECLDTSIGQAIEDQGAFLYSGSEGHLYEPMYDGVICISCGAMLCDLCQSELVDETRCPKCGGTLRQIIEHRLPKAED